MKRTIRVTFITLITFAIYFILDDLYFNDIRKWLNEILNQKGISHIIAYIISGIPIYIGVLILHRKKIFFKSLGLDKSIIEGFIFSFICTLPMFIGFAVFLDFNTNISLNVILINIIAASFFEELFYRGFLFGQIFRFSRMGFILSVIVGAILFGLIHLSQGKDPGEWIGIFLITFLGGILFAWIYSEWKYNLWIPIFIHMLMNLSFELFSAGENALGGIYLNIFRTISIILIIVLTVIYKKRKKIRLEINNRTFWLKNKNWLQQQI